jgi:ribonuclease HI
MIIEVYSDGSATTNDKPGGWAYVFIVDGVKHSEGSGHLEKASNNDAELEAAIQGLEAAYNFINQPEDLSKAKFVQISDPTVTLVADSQLVLGWTNGTYTFRQQGKIEKYKRLNLLVKLMNVKTRWVEGHTGDEHNERCDKLANEARLQLQKKENKVEAILSGKTAIGTKKIGVVCFYYKDKLKVIDLDNNICEDYDRSIHGTRGSLLEIREDKLR